MMERRLQSRLDPLARMLRHARLFRALAICWAVAAAVGLLLFLMEVLLGRALEQPVWIIPAVVGLMMAGLVLLRRTGQVDVIREMEPDQPEVKHLLAAASEQRAAPASGAFSFLQLRVIDEALAHPRQAAWREQLKRRLALAHTAHAFALLALAASLWLLGQGGRQGAGVFASLLGQEITVTPGDTQVERGTGLVIAARFSGSPPAESTLVLNYASGKESRLPMARRLADPVFGASIPEISEGGVYHIDYRGKKTRDYKIAVFEYPALVRADATVNYPAYTGLTNRTIWTRCGSARWRVRA